MYICFYFLWHELEYEFFSNFENYSRFLDSYKDDSHFDLLCTICNRNLIYFDPDEFDICSRKAGVYNI